MKVSDHFAGCPNPTDIGFQKTGQDSDKAAAENIRFLHPQIGYLVRAVNYAEKTDKGCAKAVDEQPAHRIAAAVKTARKRLPPMGLNPTVFPELPFHFFVGVASISTDNR